MFKLRVSNTRSNLSIAVLAFGPGIAVFIIGPWGSSEKKACSSSRGGAAAIDAIVRRKQDDNAGAVIDERTGPGTVRRDEERKAWRKAAMMQWEAVYGYANL